MWPVCIYYSGNAISQVHWHTLIHTLDRLISHSHILLYKPWLKPRKKKAWTCPFKHSSLLGTACQLHFNYQYNYTYGDMLLQQHGIAGDFKVTHIPRSLQCFFLASYKNMWTSKCLFVCVYRLRVFFELSKYR